MRKSIVVVDDFYEDLDAVRAYALAADWYSPYQAPGVPANWSATRFTEAADCPFKSSTRLVHVLEGLTGDRIDMDAWKSSFPVAADGRADIRPGERPPGTLWNCCFHFKPARNKQPVGEGVHNHVTDVWNGVGADGWAGLIYLDPVAPLDGGLRLWRNVDPAHDLDWMTPAENWKLVDRLGNVANRLILHRGDLPHSGSAGWGTTPADGRLYQTFFFKVHPVEHSRSLRVASEAVS
jgi:hypothetical protein